MQNYLCSEVILPRCSPERYSASTKQPPGEQPCRRTISTKLLCNFIEITTTHGCAPDNSMHTRRTPSSRRALLGNCFSMSKELKDEVYKKLLFAVIKRNLFTHKIRVVLPFFLLHF